MDMSWYSSCSYLHTPAWVKCVLLSILTFFFCFFVHLLSQCPHWMKRLIIIDTEQLLRNEKKTFKKGSFKFSFLKNLNWAKGPMAHKNISDFSWLLHWAIFPGLLDTQSQYSFFQQAKFKRAFLLWKSDIVQKNKIHWLSKIELNGVVHRFQEIFQVERFYSLYE